MLISSNRSKFAVYYNFIVYYNNGDLILMDSETAAETRLFYNLADGIGMKTLKLGGMAG